MLSELEKNYFELFGLPARFPVDLPDLAVRYRELQKQFHPDKFASGSDAERRMASQMAAQINAAYQVLRSPLERGSYLLGMEGIQLDDEKDTKMNPAFLMEQMELREELEASRLAADPMAALVKLSKEVEQGTVLRIDQLAGLLSERKESRLKDARNVLRELQFLKKFIVDVEQMEDEFI